jgi:hypothetical protein
MAKYIYITGKMGSEWTEEYDTIEEAINAADSDWNHLTDHDKKTYDNAFILESANPDEEAPDHYDGDYIKIYKGDI